MNKNEEIMLAKKEAMSCLQVPVGAVPVGIVETTIRFDIYKMPEGSYIYKSETREQVIEDEKSKEANKRTKEND